MNLYLCKTENQLFNTKKQTDMGLLNEFKDFAVRGNVIDLAVGVIIGGLRQDCRAATMPQNG
jgi:hypothetical protein